MAKIFNLEVICERFISRGKTLGWSDGDIITELRKLADELQEQLTEQRKLA